MEVEVAGGFLHVAGGAEEVGEGGGLGLGELFLEVLEGGGFLGRLGGVGFLLVVGGGGAVNEHGGGGLGGEVGVDERGRCGRGGGEVGLFRGGPGGGLGGGGLGGGDAPG